MAIMMRMRIMTTNIMTLKFCNLPYKVIEWFVLWLYIYVCMCVFSYVVVVVVVFVVVVVVYENGDFFRWREELRTYAWHITEWTLERLMRWLELRWDGGGAPVPRTYILYIAYIVYTWGKFKLSSNDRIIFESSNRDNCLTIGVTERLLNLDDCVGGRRRFSRSWSRSMLRLRFQVIEKGFMSQMNSDKKGKCLEMQKMDGITSRTH